MFYLCERLREIKTSKFDTKNVEDFSYMFFGCRSLTSLDVSNFETPKANDMSFMFRDCTIDYHL